MQDQSGRIALVTGANRGLGFETCRQLAQCGFHVLLTARDFYQGEQAEARLRAERLEVTFYQLDVTRLDQVEQVKQAVIDKYGRLDVLVNNAGILLEPEANVLDVALEAVEQTMSTNLYGPLYMIRAFVPLMVANRYGRVVNVSSIGGSLSLMSTMQGKMAAYRASKAALNALTRLAAAAVGDYGVKVNAMCPGTIRTDMGGPDAPRSVEEGAEMVVWLATLPASGPTGRFFKDKKEVPW